MAKKRSSPKEPTQLSKHSIKWLLIVMRLDFKIRTISIIINENFHAQMNPLLYKYRNSKDNIFTIRFQGITQITEIMCTIPRNYTQNEK